MKLISYELGKLFDTLYSRRSDRVRWGTWKHPFFKLMFIWLYCTYISFFMDALRKSHLLIPPPHTHSLDLIWFSLSWYVFLTWFVLPWIQLQKEEWGNGKHDSFLCLHVRCTQAVCVCQSVHAEASQHTVTSCKGQAFGPSLKNKVRSVMRCASNFKLHVV